MKTGIIVFAHGSSVGSANDAVGEVVKDVAREGGYALASPAFLELAHPDLPEAVAELSAQGATRVVIVPYFLTPGIHLKRDLPRLVADLRQRHPELIFDVTPPLDGHPALRQIILDRAQKGPGMLAHQIPHRALLTRYEEIGPDIRHFYFEIPDMEEFPFIAGQFVSLTEMVNGKKVTRAYSIASRPKKNTFELCINLVHDGVFTPHLFALKPGETIEMKGPHGAFVMKKPLSNSLFVATGTGIAPFRPMLQESLEVDTVSQYILVFGVRYENMLMYKEEFEALEKQYANFKFICTVTRPTEAWKGNAGRVQQYVLGSIGDRKDFNVYICGLKEMVNDVRDKLKDLGFEKQQIHFERYD